MKFSTKVSRFFNGKKTVIASVLTTLIAFAQNKQYLDADTALLGLTLTTILLGVGIGHKAVKKDA